MSVSGRLVALWAFHCHFRRCTVRQLVEVNITDSDTSTAKPQSPLPNPHFRSDTDRRAGSLHHHLLTLLPLSALTLGFDSALGHCNDIPTMTAMEQYAQMAASLAQDQMSHQRMQSQDYEHEDSPGAGSKRKSEDGHQTQQRAKRNRYISIACNECKRRKASPCDARG